MMRLNRGLVVMLVIGFANIGPAGQAFAQASFTGLGDLAGGDDYSRAMGVSADGTVVCGMSKSASGTEAFKWTVESGMVPLGDLPGGNYFSAAQAISDDGRVIVGRSSSSNAAWPNTEGFSWTSGGGMTGIGVLNGLSPVFGVSADGTMLVGFANPPGESTQGFIWTSDSGFTGLGLLTGDNLGWAQDADQTGALVVGFGSRIDGQYARKYTSEDGWASLFSGSNGAALSVTADGSVITGRLGAGASMQPLRWTSSGGAAGVGNAMGTDKGAGWDLSADGSVIVGTAELLNSSDRVAIIWIDGLGTFQLREWLESGFGLDLSGWTLTKASGVSDDGLVIVGTGMNSSSEREGWRVVVPWLHCRADWNKDGKLDRDDFSSFHSSWVAGDADFNGDTRTNTLDWLAFFNAYNAGC